MRFCVAGATDSAPCQKWEKREGFVKQSKRVCKDACRVAGAEKESYRSGMLGGQHADFMRRPALWSIRSSGWQRASNCASFWFSKKQPLAATCPNCQSASGCKWLQVAGSGWAATCSHSHRQSPAATCNHLQQLAATCSHVPSWKKRHCRS